MRCSLILVHHHPTPASHCPERPTSLPKVTFLLACNMSDQLQSSRIEALFESALHDYENQTGIPLAKHPLAEQLQNCQSVDSVTTLLQDRARAFNEYRGSDKIMKSLRSIVSVLSRVSATAALGQNICMSFPPAHAIHTGLGILLIAFNGVSADFDALVDVFESIDHFLKRLDIYTKVPSTPALNEIVVGIMVELLSTLALATKQIRQGRSRKFVRKLFGENDIEGVLQRLDRLTEDEARVTAAQTLEVVHGLFQNMRVAIDDGKASADRVQVSLEILQEMASKVSKLERDKIQKRVRRWLSPPDPWKNHNLARGSQHTGTAAWFVRGRTLSEWKSSGSSSLLWVHGKPGAGKSVFCSTIIENINSMTKSGLASLAFFYCDFREDEKRDLRGLLSSVLAQLCHQSEFYCQILSKLYSEHANGFQHPSDDELIQCFKDILEVQGRAPVYLIVDGLDECSNTPDMPSPRENILKFLEDLVESKYSNLRICVTSRPEIDIKVALEPLAFRCVSLHDESEQRKDIESYIRSIVNTDAKMRRWKAVDKELVIDALIEKSDGMFRWVYCQVAYLRRCLPGRIRHALEELPETLDGTYDRALQEIDKANWEFAYRLLQCVTVAFRPLSVEELAEILSFDFNTGSIPEYREGWRLGDPVDAVLSITSSLLAIVEVEGSRIIQFSHFSVKEFLTSSRLAETNNVFCRRYHISLTPAHTLAAQACLGILLHLEEHVVNRDDLKDYPLAEYAARYWVDHARFEGVPGNVDDGMELLFTPSKLHLVIWVWIFDPMSPGQQQTRQAERPLQSKRPPLHYAANYGLYAITKFLIIQHSQDVHSQAFDDQSTPLHLASRRGHEDVVRLLLEHDADLTAHNKDGWTPLHLASRNGHEKVACLLLENGADLTAQNKDGWNPLHAASESGHEEVARLLLGNGADITVQNKKGRTAFHHASGKGHEKVARLLLEHGADAIVQDNTRWTPLHLASQNGHDDTTRLLLELGADPKAQAGDGRTALYLASQNGYERVARLLLKHGADPKIPEKNGWTPLHVATFQGHETTAHLLLLEDGDASPRQYDGWTPLHLVSQNGHESLTRFLLEHGADATAQINRGWTSLHVAVRHGHEKLIGLLLEHGADVTAKQKDGSTLLHLASRWGHMGVTRSLFERGVDARAPNKHGWTGLHLASHWGHVDVARFLLGHGADPTAENKYGWTPLRLALQGGHVQVVRLFDEHGADTGTGEQVMPSCQMALHQEDLGLARMFDEHDTDTTCIGEQVTPLCRVALHQKDLGLAHLFERDANATAWSRIIGFITIIIARCFMFLARAILGKQSA